MSFKLFIAGMLACLAFSLSAQQQYDLDSGWKCREISKIAASLKGEEISGTSYPVNDWMPAVVPGTVLTTLLANKLIPDPFYGMNNANIPDIYTTGADLYTYWFVKEFAETYPAKNERVWLQFRGVNNSCDIYVNGHKVNRERKKSMFLRQRYDITSFLSPDGRNRVAVLVYPPEPPGNPNGGQGGDGTIAHNLTNQFTAGWDWIQPIHDRNTGIWDKVSIKKTKRILIEHTHVVTIVPGTRSPGDEQAPAAIKVTAEAENTDSNETVEGILQYRVANKKVKVNVTLPPHSRQLITFPELTIKDPKLWWPNGYGGQPLYHLRMQFVAGKEVSDEEEVIFGIRQLNAVWNHTTKSREIRVNGQPIFIKGGNWIVSDAMLRCSPERYNAEVRFHRDMNLNLIRVWGGGITERPEFYDACDRYGLLVMQDFWVSGDCNGRWYDPLKAEDTNARRKYPDDHRLFVETLSDQVQMLRNHPSLALWCGGNEIRPPADVLQSLRDTLLPRLDGTRFFFEYSNDDSMSLNGGDGPYTIQPPNYFWEHRSFPFNSEIGSVGLGDYHSLERFLPKENMMVPEYDATAKKWKTDPMWKYHKYAGYDSLAEAYGHAKDIKEFATKAQLVNYDQYRALMEGAIAHEWGWYTGIIVWKTQNPWTAMVGQMYDTYLDPNAGMYGLSEGSKPIHVMYDPIHKSVRIANNTFDTMERMHLWVTLFDSNGNGHDLLNGFMKVPPQSCNEYAVVNNAVNETAKTKGVFLSLRLSDADRGEEVDDNLYLVPDSAGAYVNLLNMPKAHITATARLVRPGLAEVSITNPEHGPIAFFNRISLVNGATKKRILPVFYNNNYISLLPGQQQVVQVEYMPQPGLEPMAELEGWNVDDKLFELKFPSETGERKKKR
jgi:mannosylglycoprotein endo-beta-mannosidase